VIPSDAHFGHSVFFASPSPGFDVSAGSSSIEFEMALANESRMHVADSDPIELRHAIIYAVDQCYLVYAAE